MAEKRSKSESKTRRSKDQTQNLKTKLRRYIRVHGRRFLDDQNITSLGVGYRISNGKPTKELCVQFTVASKPEDSGIALEDIDTTPIPEELDVGDGEMVTTDVLQREFKVDYLIESSEQLDERKRRAQILRPGISVSHAKGSAGTLGLIVYDGSTGDPCFLSNWHVLHRAEGRIGDQVVQPGPFDDSDVRNNWAGKLIRSHLGPPGDCAIARIEERGFNPAPFELDNVPGEIGRADLGDQVIKSGRTTGVTRGVVRRIDVMTKIGYPGVGLKEIGGFEIGPVDGVGPGYEVSQGGDSGSAWFFEDDDGLASHVVAGIHFAGEAGQNPDEHAVACYAHSVFKKLNISLQEITVAHIEDSEFSTGFDPQFTSTAAPRPWLTDEQYEDAVRITQSPMIPYTHFSVCLSRTRRLARFVAWNIDGGRIRRLSRRGISFRLDQRIPADSQWNNDLYSDNPLDRGHIARRADLVWGSFAEAQKANEDSFFFTNIAPQHAAFNQSRQSGIWGRLENAIFNDVAVENLRVSVMGGPIFMSSDPTYRGAKIPRDFWKLVAFKDTNDDAFKVAAYILTQRDLVTDLEALELDPFAVFQVPVLKLQEETQLDFRDLRSYDTFAPGPEAEVLPEGVTVSARIVRSLRDVIAG